MLVRLDPLAYMPWLQRPVAGGDGRVKLLTLDSNRYWLTRVLLRSGLRPPRAMQVGRGVSKTVPPCGHDGMVHLPLASSFAV